MRCLDEANDESLYLSVISLGEILKALRPWFDDRILPIDAPIAERRGVLSGEYRLRGKQIKVADGLIAATAIHHGLTVVTRNGRDFAGLGVLVMNPWDVS